MQYTKVAADAFEKLVLNAGIVVDSFVPATGVIGNIIGATTGGLTFNSNPTDTDFGEDVDNVPNNTKQLKHRESYDPVISGTLLTVTAALAAKLTGAADVDTTDTTKVTPRQNFTADDFGDIWMIADYSDKNEGATNAGFVAIHIMNALNTTGFQLTTGKNEKGQFPFEYHGHYDMEDMDTVPFEIYVKAGA